MMPLPARLSSRFDARRFCVTLCSTQEDSMITVGTRAPDFQLPDHLGRQVSLQQLAGKRHVMLLFYPLDFTPT